MQAREAYFIQKWKVTTPDCDLQHLLSTLKDHIVDLKQLDTYFLDIDIMADFACCVTPDILSYVRSKLHTLEKVSAGEAGDIESRYWQAYMSEHDTPPDCIYYVDNDSHVGENCLTFLLYVGGVCLRMKIYNKFVQSMKSPGVRQDLGCHIWHWTNNPGGQLYKAINDSRTQANGLTRIEITNNCMCQAWSRSTGK